MATIGSFGSLVFSVNDKKILPLRSVNWSINAKYAEHTRHLCDPLVEFVGNMNDKITFEMIFSAYLGLNPMSELSKLAEMVRSAEVNRLVIGTKAYGKNKWVITDIGGQLKEYDNKGNLLYATASVSLLAYPER
jgi:hypothetical protein